MAPTHPDNPGLGAGHCHDNLVIGNYIGTSKSGDANLGNGMGGVLLCNCQNNTVGGTGAGATNIISGNSLDGVLILGTTNSTDDNVIPDGNHITGNQIGLNISGTALPNTRNGITISKGRNNVIENNTIRFNSGRGVYATGFGSTTNVVASNNVISNNALKPQVFITP